MHMSLSDMKLIDKDTSVFLFPTTPGLKFKKF